ncbi:TetR/AcrR family transcriptional regulator [Myceligenerans pegani]|uniref:TetR/AcrR family transcriptional regulator n=1 Tax=Myceligenerans pegani TaxID=2776917 RepID=A0ABR9MYX1_9MICO|nr:TetR/AcrR family transcriptional regulator [Myceligenerans sp. TRM 65318]MBE1876280.1 TetR/AcrR family transcriptional regulator [Myceligenerans sp. TRM 65318]MBE3018551.1 TetR/AcrR family transcriptional regulator [Myceligenerans sp. TRM 65318]
MARTVNAAAHAQRRDEFLDAAQRMVDTKGFEAMSVQDVLTEAGASKGAFYHYFGSKQDLLEALADRMSAAITSRLAPVVDDADLAAVAKLRRFFADLGEWKTERRDLLAGILRVWYSDGNAVVRVKVRATITDRIAPLLARIVAQGVAEGDLTLAHPERAGRVLVALIQDLNDELAALLLRGEDGPAGLAAACETVAASTEAVERILGVPPGSVVLVDRGVLRTWYGSEPEGSLT